MIEIGVKDIADVSDGELSYSSAAGAAVRGFSIDSRTIKPGEFFIAIPGKNADGHDHIAEAVARGAAGVISERPRDVIDGSGKSHFIRVVSSVGAMGSIAGHIRSKVDIPIIAVTGTNGKTTVKDILQRLLSEKYHTLKSPSSYNNMVGVSLTLFGLDRTHEAAVFELGTNHPGEIVSLARLVRPGHAVITNIGPGHLEFFGDTDGVFREKAGVLECLPEGGAAFLSGDDDSLRSLRACGREIMFFGKTPGCEFHIQDIQKKEIGYDFRLNGELLRIPFDGEHNVYNAAAASAVAAFMGVEYSAIRAGLFETALPAMRMKRVSAGGMVFLNDAYNANPASFECALKTLAGMDLAGRKWVIAGDMLELGSRSEESHRNLGARVAAGNFDFLITLGDAASITAREAVLAGMDAENVFRAKDHEEAARIIREIARPEDMILLKGSRKMRMEDILKCFTTSCFR
ncbi:MAG: UDP-N-acetylmuramoyl-tripeptide--D-alanyl-D-alanine ligase [Candidatus Omnitrophica bacterium]|nr:UDP-N-acetylmuramoyl-tripeptide--D-alanyl-D-alanine ligase [Candidatus Omnitrophota bacterium]MBU1128814.1 UDP-N-acetylmuramoyl-tripeptide--D-alanyl-D-alanine ligase [Candidatus Omnitrophota bacterium]MBU1656660.1 UDP-N-acetylmuramoyl-tripeptide--D-alanyl-D-alanine ligase [Candidatus Omnitrophota bacterium]MBU1783793.1 UDP-N-acetylmuramoyl-tripeptide--D-alanyl-D-alanine ligase [Candidatus Omnitrophota bacterium]MBU1851193.1 UDP-N-acetylmuramoyl-tripeptide--D-alanyl-D-alanine ligase [Candidat